MSRHKLIRSRARGQGGFSLVEVLVAVLVVSVGVLGVAGLQLLSLQNNTSSMYRTQAVQSAYDIIDRARANRGEDYTLAMSASTPSSSCTDCSPPQMRSQDLASWREGLAEQLPSGTGSVEQDGSRVTVTVRWQDSRSASASLLDISVSTVL